MLCSGEIDEHNQIFICCPRAVDLHHGRLKVHYKHVTHKQTRQTLITREMKDTTIQTEVLLT